MNQFLDSFCFYYYIFFINKNNHKQDDYSAYLSLLLVYLLSDLHPGKPLSSQSFFPDRKRSKKNQSFTKSLFCLSLNFLQSISRAYESFPPASNICYFTLYYLSCFSSPFSIFNLSIIDHYLPRKFLVFWPQIQVGGCLPVFLKYVIGTGNQTKEEESTLLLLDGHPLTAEEKIPVSEGANNSSVVLSGMTLRAQTAPSAADRNQSSCRVNLLSKNIQSKFPWQSQNATTTALSQCTRLFLKINSIVQMSQERGGTGLNRISI